MKPDVNSISTALRESARALYPVAREEAAQQSRLLLCHVLGIEEPSELMLDAYKPFPEEKREQLNALLERRLAGEPLQYIIGEWEFMGLRFNVRRGALIPRQDTETLVEHALELIKRRKYLTALDLCCGTGCIGLSTARLGGVLVTLGDISESCTQLAAENAAKLNVSAKIIKSDLFGGISGRFDMILSNPPYIRGQDIPRLQREVRYEPILALAGGVDGLDFYRRIALSYKEHLNPGGVMLLEVGAGQAGDVSAMFENTYAVEDICKIQRVVVVEN